jgi:hypothetical protein
LRAVRWGTQVVDVTEPEGCGRDPFGDRIRCRTVGVDDQDGHAHAAQYLGCFAVQRGLAGRDPE